MSYILEALRRAQDQRELPSSSPAPQIETEDGRPVLRTRRRLSPALLPALIGAGMASLVLVAGWWLLRDPEQHAVPASAAAAPVAAQVLAPAAALFAPPAEPAISSLDDLTPPTDNGYPPVEGEVETWASADEDFDQLPTAPEPSASSQESRDNPETDAPLPESAMQSQTIVLEPPPQPAVPRLSEMPEAFRRTFPKLHFEVHAYDDDPAKRFVMLNGRRYRENETLSEGLLISEITPAGVIFSYQNEMVLISP